MLAALAALPGLAQAQGFGVDVDETAGGGMEEAAALYFAPPPTEEAEAAIDTDRLGEAGTVQMAIMLGRVEEGLDACVALRREMQQLIGDDFGSYVVNPGWLRRYQACVVRRAEEARAVGGAVRARQTELISRVGKDESGDAMRAADLMARLAARQSEVKIAVAREGRRQRDFVRYYNTGQMPDSLREERARPQVRVPAGERGLPTRDRPTAMDDPSPSDLPGGGAILREGEAIEGAVPVSAPAPEPLPMPDFTPPAASGAPVPLHDPDAEPVSGEPVN